MANLIYLLIGSVFGSFCTVVGYRIPLKQSIASPRSHCSSCGKTLQAMDLIPVFSYLFRRGKCHYCHSRIQPIHFWIELFAAFAFYYSLQQVSFPPLVLLVFFFFAFILSVSDYLYFLLPNLLLFFFLLSLTILKFYYSLGDPLIDLLSASLLFLFCYLLFKIFPHSFGGGDIKLLVLLTWIFGFSISLVSLFIASVTALLFIMGISIKRNKLWADPIPFAPFIFLGYTIGLLFPDIQSLYFYF
ncbi:prepilin peptidase [Lacticigenium naphthae]|uniref:prepilin peptidase n=1 Tax=Lacticigenium naphthae TaxID=515351 RepID=UPI00041DBF1C|nr:A24 family peptidase [Lacticigenium naphthae]